MRPWWFAVGSCGLLAGEPDRSRDLAEPIVGEMMAAAAQFTGETTLAEALATGASVLKDDIRVAEQPRVRLSGTRGCS